MGCSVASLQRGESACRQRVYSPVSVMVVECPHCYTRVVPSPDGVCPACTKNVRELGAGNPDLTRMQISAQDRLPPNCYLCDSPTTDTVRIRRTVVKGSGAPTVVRLFLAVVTPLWAVAFANSTRFRHSVKIRVPQCAACASRTRAEPAYVDFEQAKFTFVVHKAFRDRVQRMNERPQAKAAPKPPTV
jgi:hypothetical protein